MLTEIQEMNVYLNAQMHVNDVTENDQSWTGVLLSIAFAMHEIR